MKIYSIREYNDGTSKEYIARIDARDVPLGVRRTGFQQGAPSSFNVPPGPFAANGIGSAAAYMIAPTDKELPCEVRLEDLTKCKIEAVRGEFAILAPAMTPSGVRRSALKRRTIFESQYESRMADYWANGGVGPERNPFPEPCYHVVKIQDLVAAAQGNAMESDPRLTGYGAIRPTGTPIRPVLYDGKTSDECLGLFTKLQHDKIPPSMITQRQRDRGREMWTAALAAKSEAAKAEAKAKADALVGWNPYEGDDL